MITVDNGPEFICMALDKLDTIDTLSKALRVNPSEFLANQAPHTIVLYYGCMCQDTLKSGQIVPE